MADKGSSDSLRRHQYSQKTAFLILGIEWVKEKNTITTRANGGHTLKYSLQNKWLSHRAVHSVILEILPRQSFGTFPFILFIGTFPWGIWIMNCNTRHSHECPARLLTKNNHWHGNIVGDRPLSARRELGGGGAAWGMPTRSFPY